MDHGPISVHEKMRDLGMTPVPSTAALARIFRDANVARAEPRKKPRASYRRFVYPAPNACWQLDATDYVLTGGRTCVIFQLIDDHSRYAVASHVASGETAEGAITVVEKAIAAHGVPATAAQRQRGRVEPVPTRCCRAARRLRHRARRRGDHRQALQADHAGQERTLPPDPVPLARQAAHRRHPRQLQEPGRRVRPSSTTPSVRTRACPGRITPLQAWETTPKAEPPRPRGDLIRPVGWDGVRITRVARNGIVQVRSTRFHVTRLLAGQTVYLIETNGHLLVFNDRGTEIMQHRWPKPGTAYVSSGRPRGRHPKTL